MKNHDDVRLWDRDQFFDRKKGWRIIATINNREIKVFNRSHVHKQVELWSKRHATWYQDNLLPIELWCIKHDDAIDMVVTGMVWGFSFLFLWWLKQHVTIPKVY